MGRRSAIRWRAGVLCAYSLLLGAGCASAGDGAKLVTAVHEPDGAVIGLAVVAPGAGYDMDQPLITAAAQRAAARGYRTLRFNWRYYTAGSERGSDLAVEVQDLTDAIAELSVQSPEVDHIVIIGKSLGSIVAARVAAQQNTPTVLLTPVCRSAEQFRAFYADVGASSVFIAGDQDPLCNTDILRAGVPSNAKLAIIGGDHSFNPVVGDGVKVDDDKSAASVEMAADLVGYWLDQWRPSS